MAVDTEALLTTGEAAAALGCSRQHVTDLCRQGVLPFRTVGTHRRVARSDLERLAFQRDHEPPADIVRQRLRSLWLHRAVAGRLAADPEGVMGIARLNLVRARMIHPRSRPWIEAWQAILRDPELVMDTLASTDERSHELRQNTPFAGVLDEGERSRILEAFAAWWSETHAS
jgi:excisionase family DNA binding protein